MELTAIIEGLRAGIAMHKAQAAKLGKALEAMEIDKADLRKDADQNYVAAECMERALNDLVKVAEMYK